jgi:hypothetical protein
MGYKIKIEEIIGKTFGELTVISNAGTEQLNGVNTKRIVNCKCNCGDISTYTVYNLISGRKKACKQCNIDKRIIKRTCLHCENIFEQRNMTESKRFGGYVCKDCFMELTTVKCKKCENSVNTSNGNHSGMCKTCWIKYRTCYDLLAAAKYRSNKNKIPFGLDMEWIYKRIDTCEVTGITLDIRSGVVKTEKQNYSNRSPLSPSIDKIDPDKGYLKDNCRVVCWWYNLSKSIWSDSLVSGIINQWIENKGEFWQISLNTHLVQNVDQEII